MEQRQHIYRPERQRNNYERRISGRGNPPNYGNSADERGRRNAPYGYGQGSHYSSNAGGRAYGQNYGQYQQDSYERHRFNGDEYEGRYNEPEDDEDYYDYAETGRYPENNYDEEEGYPGFQSRYEDDGYQVQGQTEGFGRRNPRQHQGSWEEQDEYRGGHGMRHPGFGRYGGR